MLSTAIAGGNQPDMADVAQPGLVKQLVQQGKLKPITYAKSAIAANFSPAWEKLGEVNGKVYALLYKASNKSTLLVQRQRPQAGGRPGAEDLVAADQRRQDDQGVGHTCLLALRSERLDPHDIFENLYLRRWGQTSTTPSRPTRSSGPIRR